MVNDQFTDTEKEALIAGLINDPAILIPAIKIKVAELRKQIDRYESFLATHDASHRESSTPIAAVHDYRVDMPLKFTTNEGSPSGQKEPLPKMNWFLLALSALTSANGVSTSNELYDIVIGSKEELRGYSKTRVVGKISLGLSKLYRKDKVKKIDNQLGRGNFWGLSSWFDGDKVNEEYKERLLKKYGVDEVELFGE